MLIRILKNSLGSSSLADHTLSRDAHQAFIAHHHLQVESLSQVFAITEHFMELVTFSFESYNGTRVQFVTNWFKKLRFLNDFAIQDDHLTFIFVCGILMYAVSSCEFLFKVVKEAIPSDHKASNVAMLRQISIQEAILTDHRDNLACQGKTRRTHMNAFNIDHNPDYANYVTQRDASGRLPDQIFSQFNRVAKTAWTKLPYASQKIIVSSLTEPASTGIPSVPSFASGQSPNPRQVYFHNTSPPPDDDQFYCHHLRMTSSLVCRPCSLMHLPNRLAISLVLARQFLTRHPPRLNLLPFPKASPSNLLLVLPILPLF